MPATTSQPSCPCEPCLPFHPAHCQKSSWHPPDDILRSHSCYAGVWRVALSPCSCLESRSLDRCVDIYLSVSRGWLLCSGILWVWNGARTGTGAATTTCTPRATAPMTASPCTPLRRSSSRPAGTLGNPTCLTTPGAQLPPVSNVTMHPVQAHAMLSNLFRVTDTAQPMHAIPWSGRSASHIRHILSGMQLVKESHIEWCLLRWR